MHANSLRIERNFDANSTSAHLHARTLAHLQTFTRCKPVHMHTVQPALLHTCIRTHVHKFSTLVPTPARNVYGSSRRGTGYWLLVVVAKHEISCLLSLSSFVSLLYLSFGTLAGSWRYGCLARPLFLQKLWLGPVATNRVFLVCFR